MEMIHVSSSSISMIGYDQEHGTLRVVFHDSGVYDYHGVPLNVAHSFLRAPSKGKFYVSFIKGRFSPVRIQ